MADVIVSLKVMPKDVKINFKKLEDKISSLIKKYSGEVGKVQVEEVAFGLKSLNFVFVIDEDKGVDDLEESIRNLDGVSSVEITDVRRAIG